MYSIHTVDGRNPAPVDMVNIPLFTSFHACWVVSRISSINSTSGFPDCQDAIPGETNRWKDPQLLMILVAAAGLPTARACRAARKALGKEKQNLGVRMMRQKICDVS